MRYDLFFSTAESIKTDGKIVVPSHYTGETNFIIPDQIVNFCINKFSLLKYKILDPMCGLGTIPRIINALGGHCMGIEINENRFNAALELVNKTYLMCADYLEVELHENSFHCIFTSLPFDWFKNSDTKIDPKYVIKFNKLLTDDGFILLDSIPFVIRAGEKWAVASKQCAYLEANGFILDKVIRFKNAINVDCSDESVIMKFSFA